jgi:hypothetical protein
VRLERQPWEGAATWLALQAIAITSTLARLDDLAAELGADGAAQPIAQVRQVVTEEWSQPAAACASALALLPALEAALPIPPAA